VNLAELRKEKAIQKELAQRRQKVEDGLALIGPQSGFKTPDIRNMGAFNEKELKSPDLKARCYCDAPLASLQHMNIFALLVIQNSKEAYGLLVRLVDGTSNDYQRIGAFELDEMQLKKFSHISKEEEFFLI